MSIRMIRVNDCGDCPHLDHKGAFGRVAYIPVCRNANKDLPYTVDASTAGFCTASQTGGIPDWCPLERMPA